MDIPTDKAAEALLEILRNLGDNDEVFELRARSKKKMFDALVKAGFTEDQAIRIVAGMGGSPA
jgi:hypothetical protein